jgi:hypothetical protein
MKAQFISLLLISGLLAGAPAAPVAPEAARAPEHQRLVFDFEVSLEPFIAGASNHKYPGKRALRREAEARGTRHPTDNWHAALTNTGSDIIYMVAPVAGVGQALRVEFVARDLRDCERCAMVVYEGLTAPEGIAGFERVGDSTLRAEWASFRWQRTINGQANYVAVGVLNLDRSTKLQRAAIDNLRITFLDD